MSQGRTSVRCMDSGRLVGGAADALHQISEGLALLGSVGTTPLSSAHAQVLIREVELVGRQLDAAKAQLVDDIEYAQVWRDDGHANAGIMVRHHAKLSKPEAGRRRRCGRMLHALEEVRVAWCEGRIGSCHAALISRVFANRRVRTQLEEDESLFVAKATALDYIAFDLWVQDWLDRADQDGTCDDAEQNHESRKASLIQDFDKAWRLKAQGGTIDGAEMREVFDHFIEAEFQTDWEKARAEFGDDVAIDQLARTPAQRRFDALYAIFMQAASAAPGTQRPRTVTNIVMDVKTYEHHLARLTDPLYNGNDSRHRDDYRCSTIDGHMVDPTEAVANSLVGHVRRVVVGADGVVVNMSRTMRLFTGSAALAARLTARHCYWPGCYVPVSHCDVDHLRPFSERDDGSGGGATDQANGSPACRRHNRFKERGFTVHRDEVGDIHIYRPDGTLLT